MASQFHFYAFFSLIGISGLFFLHHFKFFEFKKLGKNLKKVFSKNILISFRMALLVILITYTPVIISDLKTNGSNTKNFFGAFSEKSRDDKTFNEKLIRNFREQAKAYFLITTSFEHRSGKKSDPIPVAFGLFSMALGIHLSIYLYRKEKKRAKKNFLFLMPIWISLFFLLTISTSYGLRPRYFVPVFPVPFIIIGLFLVWLDKKFPKQALLLSGLIVSAILLLNLYGTKQWFVEMKLSQIGSVETDRTLILKKDDGITLGQFKKAVDHITENTQEKHVLVWTKAEYKQPLKYLLIQKRPGTDWDFVSNEKELYEKQEVFAVNTIKGGYKSVSKSVSEHTTLKKSVQFGQIMVMELEIDSTDIPRPEPKKETGTDASSKTERLFWKDVL